MSVKRRKMGMSRKERFVRSVGLTSAFFMLISCFLLIGLLVMDIIGFNIVEIDKPREYWIQFQSEERMLVDTKVVRGNKIDKPGDPSHSPDEYFAYTFRGWDITGDNSPDVIPNRAFYDFLAVAVFQKRQIKPLPKSSSEPESESSEEGEGSSSEFAVDDFVVFDEVVSYGA